jgi:hypothetical protein
MIRAPCNQQITQDARASTPLAAGEGGHWHLVKDFPALKAFSPAITLKAFTTGNICSKSADAVAGTR